MTGAPPIPPRLLFRNCDRGGGGQHFPRGSSARRPLSLTKPIVTGALDVSALPAVPPTNALYMLVALAQVGAGPAGCRAAAAPPPPAALPLELLLLELLLLELLPQAATNRVSPIVTAASTGLMLRLVMSPLSPPCTD